MSTRFRLGKGFTIGSSGLRYGRSIPGVDKSYVSVGKSGTLLAGYGVRHWAPGKRGVVVASSSRADIAAAVLILMAVIGLFAFIAFAEQDYAASQRTPAATIDCASDPNASLYYACTDNPSTVLPTYRR